jgi:UDP-N-acetylmuramoyl-tripeptide--D-alanyl-D-alanine ligase
LLTIGPLSAATAAAAQEGIAPLKQAQHFDDKGQLSQYLANVLQPRDTVLVKASRSIGLEEVVEQIT